MAEWTPKDYTPFFLKDEPTHSVKEIRAEYSRLRGIALTRSTRLSEVGAAPQAAYLREIFPTLAEMEEIISKIERENEKLPVKKRKRVPTTADFLTRGKGILDDRAYSVKGLREIQQYINKETGELVPLGEVLSFSEFMKSWRLSAFSKLIVPSMEAAEMHSGEEYQEIGGSFSDFYVLYKQM